MFLLKFVKKNVGLINLYSIISVYVKMDIKGKF